MSKEDRKKNQSTENDKRDGGTERVPSNKSEVTEGKMEDVGSRDTAKSPTSKIPSRGAIKRLKEMGNVFRQSSNTDRLIAAFTGLLVFVAIAQSFLLYMQIDTMRKDQRPWVKFIIPEEGPRSIKEGATTMGAAQLINSGKTPAKNVFVKIAVQKLGKGDTPNIEYNLPLISASTGILYPNAPTGPQEGIPYGILKNTAPVEFDSPTREDIAKFVAGDSFYIVYGEATYTDFFSTKHWTHFCTWIVAPTPPGETRLFQAQKCTAYNDVDDK